MRCFFTLFTLFILGSIHAQDSTIKLSKLERFATEPGRLVRMEMIDLGEFSRTSFIKVVATDLRSGQQDSALRIFPSSWKEPNPVNTSTIYLEAAEVDTLINLLGYFNTVVAQKGGPQRTTYYRYVLPGDVEVSLRYSSQFLGGWDLELSRIYQQERTVARNASFTIRKSAIPDLIEVLKRFRQQEEKVVRIREAD